MLTAEHFDRLYAMWMAADRLPCMVFLGDFWQLPGPQKPPSKVSDSQAWQHVKQIQFNGTHRCDCPRLAKKLGALRTSVPSKKLLKKIADRNHRAWDGEVPGAWDVLQILRKTNYETTFVTISRGAADHVNKLAVQVLFADRHQKPLAQVPLDWETAPENYENKALRKQVEAPVAEIYDGMRLVLTKNLNKKQARRNDHQATCSFCFVLTFVFFCLFLFRTWFAIHDVWDRLVVLLLCALLAQDFVNGMVCQVMSFDSKSGCLQVQTATGKRLAVPSIREKVNGKNVDHFPVRVGYASTVPKVQGQTLKHLTFWPDVSG